MRRTVVVIDDDLDDLEMIRYVLKKADSNVLCISFNCPVEAIKQLCDERFPLPDYIFIDVNMPLINGIECLLELRRVDKFVNTPIIMFSTSMPEGVAEDLKRSGATFTFEKPFNLDGYIEILKSLTLIGSLNIELQGP